MKLRFSAFLLSFLLCFTSPSFAGAFITYPLSCDIGQAFAVSITSKEIFEKPVLKWMGQTVTLDVKKGGDGYISYALLGSFVRDVKPGEYPLIFEFKQNKKNVISKETVRLTPRKYPEERLTVSSKMIFPAKTDLPRIKAEAALASAAKKTMTVKRSWTTPPHKPLPGTITVTSSYGFRRIYNGVPKGYHSGTDFRAVIGTNVLAPFAGKVILTGDHYYAGKSVYVDSGNGVITMFFHLDQILVKTGQSIKKGQIVGKSGVTGRITGPHLHLGICLAGQYVDPMPLFDTSITNMLKAMPAKIVGE